MFARLRSLLSNITTHSSTQPAEDHIETLKRSVILWLDDMIPRASNSLEANVERLMTDLIFRYRAADQRIDFWLSGCSSGCCNPENTPSSNIAIGSFPCTDWEQVHPIITERLREIARDQRHRYYERICIRSTPDRASLDTDHTIKRELIIWSIRPSANVLANLPTEPRVNSDAPIFHCGPLPDFRSHEERAKK